MAVTKIRKISSWTFIAICLLSLVVLGLFYFGGELPPLNKQKYPLFTNELLLWMYLLFVVCAVSMLIFGITQFVNKFKTNTKASLTTLGVLAGFALLMFLSYAVGDATPLAGLNKEAQKFNIESWLKITDMWLYGMYMLLGLSICAIAWGSIKKALSK
jgi:hypothetical protein